MISNHYWVGCLLKEGPGLDEEKKQRYSTEALNTNLHGKEEVKKAFLKESERCQYQVLDLSIREQGQAAWLADKESIFYRIDGQRRKAIQSYWEHAHASFYGQHRATIAAVESQKKIEEVIYFKVMERYRAHFSSPTK